MSGRSDPEIALRTERGEPAAVLARLSTEVHAAAEGTDARAVVDRVVQGVGPCEHSSLTLREGGVDRSVATSSALAARADALQHELGEGPCLDPGPRAELCVVDDVRTDLRWPRWSAGIADLGLRSVLSLRLGSAAGRFGVLNLFASRAGAFGVEDVDLAAAYAVIAGNAMHAARRVHHLESALTSRHAIGVAQGILMARYDLPMDRAFALLQRWSSHSNTKLRDVAAHVVEHGRLPEAPRDLAGDLAGDLPGELPG